MHSHCPVLPSTGCRSETRVHRRPVGHPSHAPCSRHPPPRSRRPPLPPPPSRVNPFCACPFCRGICCRCDAFRCRQPRCRRNREASRHMSPGNRGHHGLLAKRPAPGTIHLPQTLHAVPLRWKVCTSTYSMQQHCTALYCTFTGAWLVRGKAYVSVSGTGTVEGIEPFKPALLRGSFQQ